MAKNVRLRNVVTRWFERFARGEACAPWQWSMGVSVGTVAYWVEHARGQRLDRVSFDDRKPGRAWNRIRMEVEARILSVRRTLREDSVLGEYEPDAIRAGAARGQLA